jgi:hypothetical protein
MDSSPELIIWGRKSEIRTCVGFCQGLRRRQHNRGHRQRRRWLIETISVTFVLHVCSGLRDRSSHPSPSTNPERHGKHGPLIIGNVLVWYFHWNTEYMLIHLFLSRDNILFWMTYSYNILERKLLCKHRGGWPLYLSVIGSWRGSISTLRCRPDGWECTTL